MSRSIKPSIENNVRSTFEEARQDIDVNWQQEVKVRTIREIATEVRKALEEDDDGRGFTIRLLIPPEIPIFKSARDRMVKLWKEICERVAEEEGFRVDAPDKGESNVNFYVAHFS